MCSLGETDTSNESYWTIGVNHNETCRGRIKEFMADDQQYRHLVDRHRQASEGGEISTLTYNDSEIDVISQQYHEERRGHVDKAIHRVN